MGSTSTSTFDLIETAFITGGGGGIGKALSKYLISQGKQVIIAGRTESKLKDAAKEIGAKAYYVLDTGEVDSIHDFVQKLLKEHPDVNCLFNNAGVQRPFQFPGSGGKDYDFDLKKADQEIDINIRGPMHLCVEMLPHLSSLPAGKKGVIVNVSSVLAYNPSSVINPCYNGTKAWIHNFTLNLQTQFAENQKVKVVELVPPTVATDLHRERVDPDDNKKEKSKAALSVEEFMEQVVAQMKEGREIVSAGVGQDAVTAWQDSLGKMYYKAVGA